MACADLLERNDRLTSGKSLVIDDPSLLDLNIKPFGKSIDDRCANAVETAGHLVSAAAEFTACVELGKYEIYCVSSGLVVNTNGDSSSVVRHSAASVLIDRHLDVCAVTCKRLID